MRPLAAAAPGAKAPTEWDACAAIVRMAVSKRTAQGNNWLSWSLLALPLPFGAGLAWMTGDWSKVVGIGAGVPLMTLAWLWWHYLIDGVRFQNEPAGYKLVPSMGKRSRLTLLAAWAVLSLSTGLVFSPAVGSPLLSCLAAALLLAISGALIRWEFALVFVGVCSMPYLWEKLGLAPLPFEIGLAGLAALAGALLLVCGLVLSRALGRAAPRQAGWRHLQDIPVYGSFLGADCEGGNRTRLLMHVLGPQAHTGTQALIVALVLAGGAFMIALSSMPLAVARVFFLALAVALQFAVADRLASALYARGREQALLRLAVHAPDARAFNTVLSDALGRQFLGWWATTTMLALVLVYLTGIPARELMPLFAVFCLTLLAGGPLLRDYARKPHYSKIAKTGTVLLFTLTNGMLMLAISGAMATMWWVLLAVLAAAAAAVFMTMRLRAMRRAPAAFPAGRMG